MPEDDEVDYDETGQGEYDSGSFCRHWHDPADCDIPCAACNHPCHSHFADSCNVEGCGCDGFDDSDDPR